MHTSETKQVQYYVLTVAHCVPVAAPDTDSSSLTGLHLGVIRTLLNLVRECLYSKDN